MIQEILEQHLDDLIDLYERWSLALDEGEEEDPLLAQRINAHIEGWTLGGAQSAALLAEVDDQSGPGRVFARHVLELKGIEVTAEDIPEPDERIKRHYSLLAGSARTSLV